MRDYKQAFMIAFNRIIDELPRDELFWLFTPFKHMALLATRRSAMIISRVRLVAAMFAVLTPLWIGVDLFVFPWPLWGELAAGRIVVSVAFGVLALSYRSSNRMRDAYVALALMFAIPTLFFAFSYQLLAGFHLDGLAGAVSAGYAFLPFVMVAGLSVFPLTALEGVLFASPVLLVEVAVAALNWDKIDLNAFFGSFWLLLLIATVATLSGMSQLGFMIALVHQAIRDSLTGCFSRSSGEELLEIQYILSVRSQSPLSVAFIDLDDFKSVNDRYGHEAGDQVLTAVAEHIRANLRTGDMLARWGGEEFILIFPNTFVTDAVQAIERLRASGLGQRPDGRPVTASIGVAERSEDKSSDCKKLVDIADHRMYLAKQAGKDKVVYQG
jgi:diguanylate cyclase (GGDEF)-like protein